MYISVHPKPSKKLFLIQGHSVETFCVTLKSYHSVCFKLFVVLLSIFIFLVGIYKYLIVSMTYACENKFYIYKYVIITMYYLL